MTTVSQLPIGMFVGWFVVYVITHVAIGYWAKATNKQFKENPPN